MRSGQPPWLDHEIEALRAAYGDPAKPVKLAALAKHLGRNKANVCRKARALGLTNQHRRKTESRSAARSPRFSSDIERRAHQSKVTKERIATLGHPRGALGMKHGPDALAKMAAATKRAWANPGSRFNSAEHRQMKSDSLIARVADGTMRSGHTRCAGGRRADLGDAYFRSAWEANYARFLNFMVSQGHVASWEYESKTFVFDAIKRGTRAYTPDFRVVRPNGSHEWHEVKGWMDPASATRLRRMARYFPDEVVVVIGEDWFRQARRSGLANVIPGWETKRRAGS